MALTTITVTGSYPPAAGTSLSTGYVTFTPTARVVNSSGHTIIPQLPIQVQLQLGGFSLPNVITTDSAGLLPAGWAWQVTESITGTTGVTYTVDIPSTYGSTVDLSQLSPVTPAPTTSSFVQVGGDLGGTGVHPLVTGIQGMPVGAPPGSVYAFLNGTGNWTSPSAPVVNVRAYGATGTGSVNDTTAIQTAITALATAGSGTLYFPPGAYQVTGLLFQGMSNFTVQGGRGATLTMAPNTLAAPNQGYANVVTVYNCTDFAIDGISIDGRRDSLFPIIPLAVNASSGQAAVQVAHGASASLVVGQRVSVLGGLTANSGNDQNLQDQFLTVQTITPGAGSANDTITFTTNLANTYHFGTGTVSDGYGPYAANGAYVTPWQNGTATVAGLPLAAEDQQNGLHLIQCQRFAITECDIHDLWESPIRCGTHSLTAAQTQGVSYGAITGNVLWHGYDQGVGLWCSSNVTVTGNVVTAAGWAGICLTGSDRCTVSGNVSSDNVQLIPNGQGGYGVAIEGGFGNTVVGNQLNNNYFTPILLTALGTLPFGGPGQLATTVSSNNLALPATTVALSSVPGGWATSGQFTVMSSAGAQQISYTGLSGNNLTGCTGGVGTLYSGNRATQYPVFTSNGAFLPVGSTTTTVTSGALFQVGGKYSIVDGPRTERVTVTAIATNVLTFQYPTSFQHNDKCQFSQAVCESNEVISNNCTGGIDAGVKLASAVRTTIDDNELYQIGLRGIDGIIWASGGLQPPYGTIVTNNTITAPDSTGNGAAYSSIAFAQCSDLQISSNRCGGALSATQESYISLFVQAVTDSVISKNIIADTFGVGLRLDVVNEWVCKRVTVSENLILRCLGEGLVLYGGQGLQVVGNTIEGCAPNSAGGYGGALDVRGVQQSTFANNNVVNNGHGGVTLDDATINSVTVHTANNTFENNNVFDDGLNYDELNAHQQQGTGFSETSSAQGPNTYLNNRVFGNGTNWNIQSTGNTLARNQNYNPVGKFTAQPAVSTTPYVNILNADATVYVTGGTVSVVSIGGQATGQTAGAFRVVAGQTITLTYSVAPTWIWFGD